MPVFNSNKQVQGSGYFRGIISKETPEIVSHTKDAYEEYGPEESRRLKVYWR